ncbi:hypothetical protein LJC33_02865 [Eubacteriales bacterium OttesenSCG-928-N13]|nr:hypothetical protein [Eubacteriales bacterium OttesenSCG-928-N13]
MKTREKARRFSGRWLLFWGAIILLALSVRDLYVRIDTVSWAMKGLYNLCIHEGIPFARALTYFDNSMLMLISYLMLCTLLGLISLFARNRPGAGYLLIPMCLALGAWGVWGLHLVPNLLGLSMDGLQLLPMAIIVLGCTINIVQSLMRKRHHHSRHSHATKPAQA